MLRNWKSLILLVAGAVLSPTPAVAGPIVTIDLGPASVSSSTATFDVQLTFSSSSPGNTIEVIQLSLFGNDPLLTAGDTDFGRFSFTPDAVTLAGWVEFSPLSSGLGLYAPLDPVAGPFLAPSATPYDLGTLTVDLSGLPGGTPLFVTLAAGPPGLGTDVGGTLDGAIVPSFADAGVNTATVEFADPDGVPFVSEAASAAVPEPGTVTLAGLAIAGVLAGRCRGRVKGRFWNRRAPWPGRCPTTPR